MPDLSIGEQLFNSTSIQDLSVAALDFTTTFSTDFRLISVEFKSDIALTESISISLISIEGPAHNYRIGELAVENMLDGYMIPCANDKHFSAGDEIRIQCSNNGSSGTINILVRAEQV